MDGYVRMYEEHAKVEDDNPTIGLILCSQKNEALARYSVLNDSKQLFSFKYMLYLPTEEELEQELKSAFEAARENADRMAMYRPDKAHRVAFERICRGGYQPNDKKFYLLSGSYGTGKSHLCLMTANVLSRSSGDPEIAGFYENYAKLNPEKSKLLKNIRK